MLLAARARPRYDSLQHKFGGCRGRRVAPSPACVPARRVTMPEGTPFIRSDASDRNADEPRPLVRLQLHQHRALAIIWASLMALRTSTGLETFFPPTSRMMSPALRPCAEASPRGSMSTTTTP